MAGMADTSQQGTRKRRLPGQGKLYTVTATSQQGRRETYRVTSKHQAQKILDVYLDPTDIVEISDERNRVVGTRAHGRAKIMWRRRIPV